MARPEMARPMIAHAGLVAARAGGQWRGALIRGPSGSGKSDLALRALEAGFRLVSDDRTELWTSDGRLFGRAPDALSGLIEVRGLGVMSQPFLPFCGVTLLVSLGSPDRMPERATETLLGVTLPVVTLDPFEVSAPAKLGRALTVFDGAHKRGI